MSRKQRIYKISGIQKMFKQTVTKKNSWERSSNYFEEICCRCVRLFKYTHRIRYEHDDNWSKKGKENSFLKINWRMQIIPAI